MPRPQPHCNWFLVLAFGLLAGCGGAGAPDAIVDGDPIVAEPLSIPIWYVIADAGGGGGGNDRLFSVDIRLAAPAHNQTALGAGTGTNNIEGSAFWPGTDTLYAFDSALLGTISLATGVWAPVGTKQLWDDGGAANINGLDKNRNPETLARTVLNDIDSMAFDPNTGVAYGVDRQTGADILIVFNPFTGLLVRGAFTVGGTAYDFIRVPPVEAGNEDIDDIAVDPYDGQLYGIANGGGLADRLVLIDKRTGVAADVGALGVNDMEGFAFYNDGTAWGTTGTSNSLYSIDPRAGTAFDPRPLGLGGTDYESIAFLTGDLNTFCGRVWCDDNGSGSQDAGEVGVANVTVILWRDINNNDLLDATTDIPLVTTNTDALGDYCFRVASNGEYVVTILPSTLPADFVLTMPNVLAATAGGFGATINGLDFLKQGTTGSLGDSIWLDVDQDGVQDPTEPGLRGVTVNLVGPGLDGLCGTPDDVPVASAVTDGGGYYLFPGNPDGAYCVDVDESTLPPGATLTTANEPHPATLLLGSNDLTADFGYSVPARLGDLVWLDVNGDAIVDAGEPGLGGVDVSARRPGADGFFGTADDVIVGTVVTASDGSYLFPGLVPGSYQVTVDIADVPPGTTLSTATNPIRLWLTPGQFYLDADFGFVGTGSIGDRVWNDLNGDGNQDAGEPGLGSVTLLVTEAGPDGMLGTADDVTFPPQITAADGSYTLGGLPPGLYRVDVDESTLPVGLRSLTTAFEPMDVPLALGANDTTIDFGYMTDSASIGDRVWDDADGDTIEDGGELGFVGVTVNLSEAGPDGVHGTADDVALPATTTGAGGAYDFTNLPNGRYRVDVDETTLPPTAVLTTANEPHDVVLGPGQDYNAADFGYRTPASIGDRIWDDRNGNGMDDAGEPGIGSVTVVLTEAGPDGFLGTADDVAMGSQMSAPDGSYLFTGLLPGFYRIDVSDATLPAGMQSTTLNDPLDEVLSGGEQFLDGDFGYWRPSSIGDLVWDDLNGDGTRDAGEPGLGSVTLTLIEAGPDGMFGTADDVTTFPSAMTAGDGSYTFAALPAGLYRVDVDDTTLPAGFGLTTGNDPLTVPLAIGQDFVTADFGFWLSASVGDRVWTDDNGDGVQDAGEAGLGGVSVGLLGAGPDAMFGTADDVVYPDVLTAPAGSYGFTSLPPGLYRVDVVNATVPAGMALTTANDPTDVTLAPGDNDMSVDFGYRHTGRIGDRLWDDLDGDGFQDAGEPGLVGVDVTLVSAGPDGVCGTADDSAPPIVQMTGAGGAYVFDNLAGGVYCLLVDGMTVPAGYVPTTGVGILPVTITPGEDYQDADFGYRRVGAIGDRVWHDLNGDGIQDAGEPGLVGVTVNLVEAGPDLAFGTADDVPFPPEVTAADGAYMFNALGAGSYRVTVDTASVPAGMQLTNAGSQDVTLMAGQGYANADFGFRHVGSIGDFVWQDLNADGMQDAGEPGLGSVTVDLVEAGPDGMFGTADDVTFPARMTMPDGSYTFPNLAPGTYRVVVDTASLPAGMQVTTGNQPLDLVLGPAVVRTDADFGYQFAGSIGDLVWEDLDGGMTRNAGEPALSGVRLRLVEAGPDGMLGTADDVPFPDEITALGGSYTFRFLAPGDYRVTVDPSTVAAGLALTTGNLPFDTTIVGPGTVTTADFGYRHSASIGDRVWNDVDGDQMQDAGETGLNGLTVDLVEAGPDGMFGTADDVPVASVVTAGDGDYLFSNLPPGLYRVTVDPASVPPGMTPTTANQPLDVPLAPGEVYTTADFGYRFDGSIGDRVWDDTNGDMLQDAGEPGLNGVTVDLLEAGLDGMFGTADDVAIASVVTAGDGDYVFGGLPPGLYRVTVDPVSVPTGMLLTTGNQPLDVTLMPSQMLVTADFGYRHSGLIGDYVWLDANADTVQDAGESGLDGIRIVLDEAGPDGMFGTLDDVAVGTQLTAGGGAYAFANLPPGVYRVGVDPATLPAGVVRTTASDPIFLTLTGGQVDRAADFGYRHSASIGDRVWNDVDGDQMQDAGETGINGLTVDLVEAGPDGMFGTADDVPVASVVTAGDGDYMFSNLPPGLYRVTVDPASVPPGMTPTTANQPLDVPLAPGEVYTTADFGYRFDGSIGDRIWDDTNGDMLQDAGEPGLNGITVDLVEAGLDGMFGTADDMAIASVVTAGDGDYVFGGLPPGLYRVTVDPVSVPTGMLLTTGNQPLDVTLMPSQMLVTADFGYRHSGLIGDYVWLDANADTVQDAGESGLDGIRLVLDEAGPDGMFGTLDDVAVGTQLTAGGGAYAFANLPPGVYRVAVDAATLPAGVVRTTASDPIFLTLTGGQIDRAADFGYRHSGSIGDRVWNDVDGDQMQDAGETGLNGLTVDLVEAGPDGMFGTADDVTLPSTMTSGDGDYGFSNLPPGLYRVTVDPASLPPGTTPTTANQPLDVPLAPGEVYTTADFGYRFDGSIGDRIWDDTNGDMLQDAGEPGLNGITVDLVEAGLDGMFGTADDMAIASVVTAGDGDYVFGGLPPGLYRVTVDPMSVPTGMLLTTGNQPLDVTLMPSQMLATADFGYRHSGLIGDYVWLDANADTVQDAGESGLDGIRIVLDEAGPDGMFGTLDDVAVGTQLTAGGGAYAFANLPPGVYRVGIDPATLPAGLVRTTALDPIFLTLTGGQVDRAADFGYRHSGSIGDRVWEDIDGDGVQDPGETGLNGVTVNAVEAGPDGMFGTADDVILASTTTSGDGNYAFSNLPPGLYRVTVDSGSVPPGMTASTANPPADIPLGPGQVFLDADVGFRHLGSIGDRIWDDVSRDGVQDAGEPGLGGVTLALIEAGPDGMLGTADDRFVRSQVTAADGSYDFTGLPAGLYRVDVDESTLPPGYVPTSVEPVDVVLATAQDYDDADFGYAEALYTVGDVIWIDANRNGLYEPDIGERPVPGVTVTVYDMSGNVITTAVTNAAGEYRVTLAGGMYRVEVDASNFLPGGPLAGTSMSSLGASVVALVSADRFDLDFPFLVLNASAVQFCSWWLATPTAWPLTTMTIGGRTYSQAEAMGLLSQGNDIAASLSGRAAARVMATADMSVLVAWALIGAKLNVAAGNNPAGVEATIRGADAWLAAVGVGSGVRNGTSQFSTGQLYYQLLGTFNGDGI